ncbi:hypothetical protein Asulf_01336 [Archaeoglobus sulfaticallidus PM70-1]|uniref:Uncharacterized protein n=1 Tax=Archaeoglobus sulfaticallidus PM70-1 TaxID=387631 RepID=N0BG99_9EURY|nr:hypothetical protein Asulf_01336 [Archaeoglobus sulfaticallidus PM70-1]
MKKGKCCRVILPHRFLCLHLSPYFLAASSFTTATYHLSPTLFLSRHFTTVYPLLLLLPFTLLLVPSASPPIASITAFSTYHRHLCFSTFYLPSPYFPAAAYCFSITASFPPLLLFPHPECLLSPDRKIYPCFPYPVSLPDLTLQKKLPYTFT